LIYHHLTLLAYSTNLNPAVVCITGASIAGLAALIYANRHQSAGITPKSTLTAKQFTTENITQRFTSAIPEITQELNLEVATSKQIESFGCSDRLCLMWGLIDLGTNIAQISMPVTYRFHIRLHDPWKLEVRHDTVIVHAPPLRPALPPAIHTEQLERLVQRGWARGSPAEMMRELECQITPTLCLFASDPRRLNLVRDVARKSVAEFVRLWLEREHQWGRKRFSKIQVQFADEPALPLAPTLKLLSQSSSALF
jgi:hypothetical protein